MRVILEISEETVLSNGFFTITKKLYNLSVYNFCLKNSSIESIDGKIGGYKLKVSETNEISFHKNIERIRFSNDWYQVIKYPLGHVFSGSSTTF